MCGVIFTVCIELGVSHVAIVNALVIGSVHAFWYLVDSLLPSIRTSQSYGTDSVTHTVFLHHHVPITRLPFSSALTLNTRLSGSTIVGCSSTNIYKFQSDSFLAGRALYSSSVTNIL